MKRSLVWLPFLLVGCAAPFIEVSAQPGSGTVTVHACGTSSVRGESAIAAMDGPPSGETVAPAMPRPRELTICVRVENHGAKPLTVARMHLHLKCPHETQPPIPDKDDDRLVVAPGETRQLRVTFQYSPLRAGEEVRLDFDDALSVSERALPGPILVLRKQ